MPIIIRDLIDSIGQFQNLEQEARDVCPGTEINTKQFGLVLIGRFHNLHISGESAVRAVFQMMTLGTKPPSHLMASDGV
jgi:hypothetical protein